MKINVALFITALSTTAAASVGDDGAAAAVDRPHLRALQTRQDTTTTTTTDKLGVEIEEAVVPSSSTLRASSLLKGNNVFTKQDGDETEDFLELGECPTPHHDADVEAHCSLDCSSCNGKTTCTLKTPTGVSFGKVHICCNSNGNSCSGSYEEEEILQDTGKLDASSPLRASLLKVE
ncbi:hypothetical protein ACHAWC_004787 [Mediolabrus comicus]